MNKKTIHTFSSSKNKNIREGNALLISILMTGILVFITISLSSLISSETRQIGNMLKKGHAEYLAESGSEIALYLIHQNKPGFEPTQNDEAVTLKLDDNQEIAFQIDSSTDHIPIVEDYIRDLVQQGGAIEKNALFDTLDINESVTIPLKDGTTRFEVQYYFPIPTGTFLPDWDILLWKLFGQDPNSLSGNIDSMSEYLPSYNTVSNSSGTNAYNPAKFGTEGGWQQGYFFEYSDGQTTVTATSSENSGIDKRLLPISAFLNDHNNKHLILTNALNPVQLKYGHLSLEDASRIKYRICTPNCQSVDNGKATPQNLVPHYSVIQSSGKFQSTQKDIRTSVNHEGFLPVFDFAIYRTKN